jgi:EAL domain-containing protein (putative c-di-GMP-specific phosphodiesterase class I)
MGGSGRKGSKLPPGFPFNGVGKAASAKAPRILTGFCKILFVDVRTLIDRKAFCAALSPVVSVKRRAVLGFKAKLSAADPYPTAGLLREAAAREGLSLDMDRALRQSALALFRSLSPDSERLLFLEVETSIMDQQTVGSGHLFAQVQEAGLSPQNVVIEISESGAKDVEALRTFVSTYRARGFLIALSDVGAGHSNLSRVALARPDILTIGPSVARDLDRDPIRQEIFNTLLLLSRKIGALAVVTDVERPEQALAALNMGVDMLEGPLWEPAGTDPDLLSKATDALAAAFKAYTLENTRAQAARAAEQDRMMAGLLKLLSVLSPDRFDEGLARMIVENSSVECLFVLNEAGLQVTETIYNPSRPVKTNGLFRPARKGADHSMKDYYYLVADDLMTRFRTEPYISQASGSLCVTLSGLFRDGRSNPHVLCVDVPVG